MRPVPGSRRWLVAVVGLGSSVLLPCSAALDGVVSGLGNPTFSFTILPLATYGILVLYLLPHAARPVSSPASRVSQGESHPHKILQEFRKRIGRGFTEESYGATFVV
jgi:hypothetical protein